MNVLTSQSHETINYDYIDLFFEPTDEELIFELDLDSDQDNNRDDDDDYKRDYNIKISENLFPNNHILYDITNNIANNIANDISPNDNSYRKSKKNKKKTKFGNRKILHDKINELNDDWIDNFQNVIELREKQENEDLNSEINDFIDFCKKKHLIFFNNLILKFSLIDSIIKMRLPELFLLISNSKLNHEIMNLTIDKDLFNKFFSQKKYIGDIDSIFELIDLDNDGLIYFTDFARLFVSNLFDHK